MANYLNQDQIDEITKRVRETLVILETVIKDKPYNGKWTIEFDKHVDEMESQDLWTSETNNLFSRPPYNNPMSRDIVPEDFELREGIKNLVSRLYDDYRIKNRPSIVI